MPLVGIAYFGARDDFTMAATRPPSARPGPAHQPPSEPDPWATTFSPAAFTAHRLPVVRIAETRRSDACRQPARIAAFEDVYSSPLRHGPEPFAKRLIMSVTNHVPAGPIESLAL